ncbi:hypothetical protein [Microbulbifer sp.]|uniref:hypothetical protein n=1 Tax=Microbulbifer sp. TaxID=1908541 RepID=UPI003F35F685
MSAIDSHKGYSRWLCWYGAANGLLAALITATLVTPASIHNGWSLLFLSLALPGHFLFLAALLALPVLVWRACGAGGSRFGWRWEFSPPA